MNKKVLIILGSPRKGGNSEILCEQFALGAKESGHEVEKVSLQDEQLGYCKACYYCREHKECIQKDGMNGILSKMFEADVIVLATPMYYYTMSGQMKTFIDRSLPRYREITNKDVYLIATGAVSEESKFEIIFDEFVAYINCLKGSKEKGRIYGKGVYLPGEVNDTKAMKDAFEMGNKI